MFQTLTAWMSLSAGCLLTASVLMVVAWKWRGLQSKFASVVSPWWVGVEEALIRREDLLVGATAILLFGLYALTRSAGGSFDEFNYAISTRTQSYNFHPNHYLPHIASRLWYLAIRAWAPNVDALETTKVLNGLFGAVNFLLVYMIGRKVLSDRTVSFETALLFAVSFGTWKFATSGEVYTVMMTFVLLTVYQTLCCGVDERWGLWPLTCLVLAANMAFLAHNATAVIALGCGLPLLLANWRRALAALVIGFVLFVGIQIFVCHFNGIGTVSEWWHHQVDYSADYVASTHGLTTNYAKALLIVLRDGTLGIMTGIESGLSQMPFWEKLLTWIAYTVMWSYFLGLMIVLVRHARPLIRQLKEDFSLQLFLMMFICFGLVAGNVSVGNDESLHWLIPFFLLAAVRGVCSLSSVAALNLKRSLVVLLPVVVLLSFGTSPRASSKMWAQALPSSAYRKDIREAGITSGDIVVYGAEEHVFLTYYLPGAILVHDAKDLPAALRKRPKARVFVSAIGLRQNRALRSHVRQVGGDYSEWVAEDASSKTPKP